MEITREDSYGEPHLKDYDEQDSALIRKRRDNPELFSTVGLMEPGQLHHKRKFLDRTFGKLTHGSIRGAIFNLCNTAIGAGVLSLPYLMRLSGLVLGLMLILISGVFTIISLHLLVNKAQELKIYSYADLCFEAGGKFLAKLL